MSAQPLVATDILIIRNNSLLLSLLSEQWSPGGSRVYGVPGREIRFGEKIGEAVKRAVLEDIGLHIDSYRIFSVNANYAFGNHYISIGVAAEFTGEIQQGKSTDWGDWVWFDMNALPKNLFPSAQNAINSYLHHQITVSE